MPLLEISDPNAATDLQFDMDGPAFADGIPVPILVDSLVHVQGIFDKSYLGLIGRRRLSQEERVRFYLRAQAITHSSLHADLGVVLTAAQLALPIVGYLGPAGILEYAKQAYDLAKLVFKAIKRGQTVNYTWTADNSVLHVNTGTQNQVYNGPVFNIASMSLPHYQGIASQLGADRVVDARLGIQESRDIDFTLPEKELFELPTRVEDQPHQVACEVYEFDKYDKDGRLAVLPGQTIPEGTYRFGVIGNQAVASYIEAMLRQQVRITCLREIAENPISGEKVFRLQVATIET